jgi:hypothetical protein
LNDMLNVLLKEFLRAPRTFLMHGSEAWRRQERDALEQAATARLQRAPVFHRRESGTIGEACASNVSTPPDDSSLVKRIVESYVIATAADPSAGDSQWALFFEKMNLGIHQALTSGDIDRVAHDLRDPSSNDLFYGFENIRQGYTAQWKDDCDARDFFTRQIYDALARLAEAAGAIPLENPEVYGFRDPSPYPVDDLLDRLDEALGVSVRFPNPYPEECGLATGRGIASYRAVQSLYQAWRISQVLAERGGESVVEIGAGLGRTAYYSAAFGVQRYSIVDLPFTLVSSAYFLGRVFDEDRITLYGEQARDYSFRLTIPSDFLRSTERVDLVVNFDSFTEIDRAVAAAYWQHVFSVSPALLSINHEANPFTVRDLYVAAPSRYRVSRHPCWMRRGYVEELIESR